MFLQVQKKRGVGRREKGKSEGQEERGRGGKNSINSKNHKIQDTHMLQDK